MYLKFPCHFSKNFMQKKEQTVVSIKTKSHRECKLLPCANFAKECVFLHRNYKFSKVKSILPENRQPRIYNECPSGKMPIRYHAHQHNTHQEQCLSHFFFFGGGGGGAILPINCFRTPTDNKITNKITPITLQHLLLK